MKFYRFHFICQIISIKDLPKNILITKHGYNLEDIIDLKNVFISNFDDMKYLLYTNQPKHTIETKLNKMLNTNPKLLLALPNMPEPIRRVIFISLISKSHLYSNV